jgi:hypothetical protein
VLKAAHVTTWCHTIGLYVAVLVHTRARQEEGLQGVLKRLRACLVVVVVLLHGGGLPKQ